MLYDMIYDIWLSARSRLFARVAIWDGSEPPESPGFGIVLQCVFCFLAQKPLAVRCDIQAICVIYSAIKTLGETSDRSKGLLPMLPQPFPGS